MVEEGVIGHVDEELAGRAVLVGSTRHGDRAAGITQAIVGFVFNRRVRLLLLHLLVKAAALHHKAWDHPVEGRVVIETAVHILQEVIDRNRRLLAIQLQLDVASRSGQQYVRVALGRHGGGEC